MAYSKAKFKSSGDKASPFFQAILISKLGQIFAYTNSTVGFI
jgi:hypothetical protein